MFSHIYEFFTNNIYDLIHKLIITGVQNKVYQTFENRWIRNIFVNKKQRFIILHIEQL